MVMQNSCQATRMIIHDNLMHPQAPSVLSTKLGPFSSFIVSLTHSRILQPPQPPSPGAVVIKVSSLQYHHPLDTSDTIPTRPISLWLGPASPWALYAWGLIRCVKLSVFWLWLKLSGVFHCLVSCALSQIALLGLRGRAGQSQRWRYFPREMYAEKWNRGDRHTVNPFLIGSCEIEGLFHSSAGDAWRISIILLILWGSTPVAGWSSPLCADCI